MSAVVTGTPVVSVNLPPGTGGNQPAREFMSALYGITCAEGAEANAFTIRTKSPSSKAVAWGITSSLIGALVISTSVCHKRIDAHRRAGWNILIERQAEPIPAVIEIHGPLYRVCSPGPAYLRHLRKVSRVFLH